MLLSRDEAEALLIEKKGKLCAQFYRRADGTILTADCEVGVAKKKARRKAAVVAGAFAAAAAGAIAGAFAMRSDHVEEGCQSATHPMSSKPTQLTTTVTNTPVPPDPREMVRGDVAFDPPPPPPPTQAIEPHPMVRGMLRRR